MCKRLDYADFRRRFGLRFAVPSSLVGRCCSGVFSLVQSAVEEGMFFSRLVGPCV
jgi:hypothetical protein